MKICKSTRETAKALAAGGAEILISINASPYDREKHPIRVEQAATRAQETGLPLIYVNTVGGQDELVFDGKSFVVTQAGGIACRLKGFTEDFTITKWRKDGQGWHCDAGTMEALKSAEEDLYQAMTLALQGYAEKNRFPGVIIGLSGGIDSALTAAT